MQLRPLSISAPKRSEPVSDQVAELGPTKHALAALGGLAIYLALLAVAHACWVWVICLEFGSRIGRGAAPVVLALGLAAQVVWLGALAWQAVTLVF
jgi:hypothetical protein